MGLSEGHQTPGVYLDHDKANEQIQKAAEQQLRKATDLIPENQGSISVPLDESGDERFSAGKYPTDPDSEYISHSKGDLFLGTREESELGVMNGSRPIMSETKGWETQVVAPDKDTITMSVGTESTEKEADPRQRRQAAADIIKDLRTARRAAESVLDQQSTQEKAS